MLTGVGRREKLVGVAATWPHASAGRPRPHTEPLRGRTRLILLFVTRVKQESLTQYEDHVSGDLLFWEGEAEHGSDARVAAAAGRGDEIYLFYREIHHTPFEYRGPVSLLTYTPRADKPSEFVFRRPHRSRGGRRQVGD